MFGRLKGNLKDIENKPADKPKKTNEGKVEPRSKKKSKEKKIMGYST